jgi:LysM repeat protein
MISLLAVPLARGQESTVAASLPEIVENYKVLKGQVENLQDANAALEKRIAGLESKLDAVSSQQGRASGDYASQDDLKALKTAIEEEDKKRQADNEEMVKTFQQSFKQITKFAKSGGPTEPLTPTHSPAGPVASDNVPPASHQDVKQPDGPGFTYVVKPNDTPTKIAKKLFDEKGIKVSADQIMAANPQVKDPKKLYIDEKLFIPAAAADVPVK